MTQWETVIDGDAHLSRAPAPGGWVYKAHGVGVCFVPAPVATDNSGKGYSVFVGRRMTQNKTQPKTVKAASFIDVEFEEVKS